MFATDALLPFVPLILIAALVLALPKNAMSRPWIKRGVLLAFGVLMTRYLWWRFTVTVWPADDLSVQSAVVWTLFVIEMIAWFDSFVGICALSNQVNRSGEANRHEARLREMAAEDLPIIDVMIATYNETPEVLEKTIVGAVGLDWPRDRLRVWVLDDGRRPWLEALATELGASYLTRVDNAHAKAGNINAGISKTSGEFFLVLDADFVPRQNFLYRTVGFFRDPKIGIVQIPHSFFNYDPMQNSLGMQRDMPDDQRFFFDAIMPGRDGWDCAFCCGSNGIVRRTAMEAIGGKMPSGSITEDMLLTLAFLRKGFITRYLNERLAVGLAPESLSAFFVQRARWARGAVQLLFLKEGPLGPGLTPLQRAMFLPTHWISQSLSQIAAMATPAFFLLTGLMPLLNANFDNVFEYQIPAIIAAMVTIRLLAPWQFNPIASTVHGVLQAFRLLPTIVVTLIKPHGHAFKVTPKGSDAATGAQVDLPTIIMTTTLILATAAGLLLNANINLRIIESAALIPIVAFWAFFNMVILTLVATIAVSPPVLRAEERFDLLEPVRIRTKNKSMIGQTRDLSLSGASLDLVASEAAELSRGDWLLFGVAEVGQIPAEVIRTSALPDDRVRLGLRFYLPRGIQRSALILRLFTLGPESSVMEAPVSKVTLGMMSRIFRADQVTRVNRGATGGGTPPSWIVDLDRETTIARELEHWAEDLRREQAENAGARVYAHAA